jgi:hypothetical protein
LPKSKVLKKKRKKNERKMKGNKERRRKPKSKYNLKKLKKIKSTNLTISSLKQNTKLNTKDSFSIIFGKFLYSLHLATIFFAFWLFLSFLL